MLLLAYFPDEQVGLILVDLREAWWLEQEWRLLLRLQCSSRRGSSG